MILNPGLIKHTTILLNNILLKNSIFENYLRLTLDSKLNFLDQLRNTTRKISTTLGLLCWFQSILSGSSLLTTYRAFIRSQLDYSDVIYGQDYHHSFHENLESIDHNA